MTHATLPILSVVIPVQNEEKNITNAINGIKNNISIPYEILVIYDTDDDSTVPVVKKLSRNNTKIKYFKNMYSPGIINAVKTGFKKSLGEYVAVMSPDLADNPSTLQVMYNKMQEGYDIVSATRYSKGGKRIGQLSFKSFLSYIAGLGTPILLGIPLTDLTNGFKMYRKRVVMSIKLQSTGGWEFTMELIIKARERNFLMTEVPTVSQKRKYGHSKFKLSQWLPKYIFWYVYGIKNRMRLLM